MDSALATIVDDGVERSETIAPGDLLAFFVRASVIGNSHFENPAPPQLCNLCNQFRFHAKAVLFYLHRFDSRSCKSLITTLHIGEVQVSEHVGEQRQKPIANHVPEKKDPVRSPAHKTRAENRVCFPGEEWLKKRRVIFGAVLEAS